MSWGDPVRNGVGVGLLASTTLSTAPYYRARTFTLDFMGGVLSPAVTFSRGSVATRVNSSGNLETVGVNTPRFDYDPVTLAPKGLLLESQRTNSCLYSEDFTNAAWVAASGLVVTADSATAPTGTQVADTLDLTSVANFAGVKQAFAVSADSATRTISVYLKAETLSSIYLTLEYFNGTYVSFNAVANLSAGTVTGTGATISNAGNGWYRVAISGANNGTNTGMSLWIRRGTTGGTVYAFGAQFEGSVDFPTSYIPTTTTSVQRNADVADVTGSNFSSWFNPVEGTFVTKSLLSRQNATSAAGIASINGGAGEEFKSFYRASGAIGTTIFDGAVAQLDQTPSAAIAANALAKVALAYKLDNSTSAAQGATLASDTSCTMPTVNQLQLGYTLAPAYLNGWLQYFGYYNTRLPNEYMAALTSS